MKRVIATLLLLTAPAQAQTSSAAPVANSSGSVTNQAVQVVPVGSFRTHTAEESAAKEQR